MESPFSWGQAERVINEAIKQAERAREEMRMGFSMTMQIANALRREGLLVDEPEDKQVGHDARDGEAG